LAMDPALPRRRANAFIFFAVRVDPSTTSQPFSRGPQRSFRFPQPLAVPRPDGRRPAGVPSGPSSTGPSPTAVAVTKIARVLGAGAPAGPWRRVLHVEAVLGMRGASVCWKDRMLVHGRRAGRRRRARRGWWTRPEGAGWAVLERTDCHVCHGRSLVSPESRRTRNTVATDRARRRWSPPCSGTRPLACRLRPVRTISRIGSSTGDHSRVLGLARGEPVPGRRPGTHRMPIAPHRLSPQVPNTAGAPGLATGPPGGRVNAVRSAVCSGRGMVDVLVQAEGWARIGRRLTLGDANRCNLARRHQPAVAGISNYGTNPSRNLGCVPVGRGDFAAAGSFLG